VKKQKYLAYVKPKKPPKWWPKQNKRFAWVGLLESGWVLGDGCFFPTKQEIKQYVQFLSADLELQLLVKIK